MDLNLKKMWPAAATSLVVCTSILSAATNDKDQPQSRAPTGVINPQAHPKNMGQDSAWFVTADAFVWQANEDGLGFAIENENITAGTGPVVNASNFYNDEMENLHFNTNFGFKLGLG